jgi:hypothetical protein
MRCALSIIFFSSIEPERKSLMKKKKRNLTFYRRLARDICQFVKSRVADGADIVHYGEVFQEFGLDRFTCAIALGVLVNINTEAHEPLWSSFVTRKGTDVCGKGFWVAAEANGYLFSDEREFMYAQRNACKKEVSNASL